MQNRYVTSSQSPELHGGNAWAAQRNWLVAGACPNTG